MHAGLEPQRKAYLMQNIMASRYIVAQQARHDALQGSGEMVSVVGDSPAATGGGARPVYRSYNQPDVLGCQHYRRRYAVRASAGPSRLWLLVCGGFYVLSELLVTQDASASSQCQVFWQDARASLKFPPNISLVTGSPAKLVAI